MTVKGGGKRDPQGLPLVISAPSGAGKTTLCHRLIEQHSTALGIEFSVSYTTRAPRGKERPGIDYHFVDDAAFDKLIENDALLEWAQVHRHRYGTGKQATLARLAAGQDILFDIDVQGGEQIAKALPGVILLFVLPPSMDELERRLRQRGSDSAEQIKTRMDTARSEIERASKTYSHFIVNDALDDALSALNKLRSQALSFSAGSGVAQLTEVQALITTLLQ